MTAALLEVRDLRLDAHGAQRGQRAPVVDGLALSAVGPRVVIVGAARALFEAASGVARPARGGISVRGEACARALARGMVAGAPRDPAMPAAWTPLEHVTWSARLAGQSKSEAAARAAGALEALGVGPTKEKLGRAPTALRRATVIAGALATGAEVIALEDPTVGLEDEVAHALARFVVRGLEAPHVTAWLLFTARAPLDSPLTQAATEALVVAGSTVLDQGAPAALAARARRYAVDAHGAGHALAARLAERGARVDLPPIAPAQGTGTGTAPGPARFVVELPEGATTRDLFACAEDVGAVVVELRPVWP